MVKVVIIGIGGKMGSMILRLALDDRNIVVAGGTEVRGHPSVGGTIAGLAGTGHATAPVVDDLGDIIDACDVVVDFSSPAASTSHFRLAQARGKAIVIGTTGFAPAEVAEMENAKDVRAVIAPNMSVGVNLMFDVVARLARAVTEGYDIEILEMHHRWKKDAPSGTALRLRDLIESARPERDWIEVYGRQGIAGERRDEEIGLMSLRGGDVVGDHTVIFAGIGERLEITHRAHTRETFARGALVAAQWIVGQDSGVYTMKDVLGIEKHMIPTP
jgi:4-hydroxy-tetrahydrodipicolinate reductase